MEEEPPESPADPRPNDEPYFIDTECICGEELALHDDLTEEQLRESKALANPEFRPDDSETWYDEWVCPECLDGIHFDWPEAEFEELERRMTETGWEEFEPVDGDDDSGSTLSVE